MFPALLFLPFPATGFFGPARFGSFVIFLYKAQTAAFRAFLRREKESAYPFEKTDLTGSIAAFASLFPHINSLVLQKDY